MAIESHVRQLRAEIEGLYEHLDIEAYLLNHQAHARYYNAKTWVIAEEILAPGSDYQAIRNKIEYYIKLASKCWDDENYFAAQLIAATLSMNPIHRLFHDQGECLLGWRMREQYERLKQRTNMLGSFTQYRHEAKLDSTRALPIVNADASDFEKYFNSDPSATLLKKAFKGEGTPESKQLRWQLKCIEIIHALRASKESIEDLVASLQALAHEYGIDGEDDVIAKLAYISETLANHRRSVAERLDTLSEWLVKAIGQNVLLPEYMRVKIKRLLSLRERISASSHHDALSTDEVVSDLQLIEEYCADSAAELRQKAESASRQIKPQRSEINKSAIIKQTIFPLGFYVSEKATLKKIKRTFKQYLYHIVSDEALLLKTLNGIMEFKGYEGEAITADNYDVLHDEIETLISNPCPGYELPYGEHQNKKHLMYAAIVMAMHLTYQSTHGQWSQVTRVAENFILRRADSGRATELVSTLLEDNPSADLLQRIFGRNYNQQTLLETDAEVDEVNREEEHASVESIRMVFTYQRFKALLVTLVDVDDPVLNKWFQVVIKSGDHTAIEDIELPDINLDEAIYKKYFAVFPLEYVKSICLMKDEKASIAQALLEKHVHQFVKQSDDVEKLKSIALKLKAIPNYSQFELIDTWSGEPEDETFAELLSIDEGISEHLPVEAVSPEVISGVITKLFHAIMMQSENQQALDAICMALINQRHIKDVEEISEHLIKIGIPGILHLDLEGIVVSSGLFTKCSEAIKRMRHFHDGLTQALNEITKKNVSEHAMRCLRELVMADEEVVYGEMFDIRDNVESLYLDIEFVGKLNDVEISDEIRADALRAYIIKRIESLIDLKTEENKEQLLRLIRKFSVVDTFADVKINAEDHEMEEGWQLLGIDEALYEKIKDVRIDRRIKEAAIQVKNRHFNKNKEHIHLLASQQLRDYLLSEIVNIEAVSKEAIKKLNAIINNPPSAEKLKKSIDRLLTTNVPLSLCEDIKEEVYHQRITHPGILALIDGRRIKAKKHTKELIYKLNYAILSRDAAKVAYYLSRLGVVVRRDAIEEALHVDGLIPDVDEFTGIAPTDSIRAIQRAMYHQDVERYTSMLDALQDPEAADFEARLYDRIIQLTIEDDALDGITSYIVKGMGDEYIYVRDAREADPKQTRAYQQLRTKSKTTLNHLNYLKMAVSYTLAVRARVLAENGEAKESLDGVLNTLIDKFEILYKSKMDSLDENGLKNLFLDYVKHQLAPIMTMYGLVGDKTEAVAVLDKLKDWVGAEFPPLSVATVDAVVSQDNAVVRIDRPRITLTPELIEEYRQAHEDDIKPLWYKLLKPHEKAIFHYYYPKIINGRELPSQLRSRIPGLKNAYQQDVYSIKKRKTRKIFSSNHSGSISYLSKKRSREIDAEMQRLAVLTGKQQHAMNPDGRHIMISLNSATGDKIMSKFIKDFSGFDELIVKNTQHAASQIDEMLSGNICLNEFRLNPFESDDLDGMKVIHDECYEALENIRQLNMSAFSAELRAKLLEVEYLLKKFKKHLDSKHHGPDQEVNGLYSIAFCARVSYQFKELKKLLAAEPSALALVDAMPIFDIWYGCASGENRTGVTEYHLQCEVILDEFRDVTGLSKRNRKFLKERLAASGHIQTITGHQGGNAGAGGIRKKSIGSLPKSYGKDIRKLLMTSWSSLKSAGDEIAKRRKKKGRENVLSIPSDVTEYLLKLIALDNSILRNLDDTDILVELLIKKPDLFDLLDSTQKKSAHYALLQRVTVIRNALRLGEPLTEDAKAVIDTIEHIQAHAVSNLQQLTHVDGEEDLSPSELFTLFREGLNKAVNEERVMNLERQLFESLSPKWKTRYNLDKAVYLIESYLQKDPNKIKADFYGNLLKAIKKNGLTFEVLSNALQHANARDKLFSHFYTGWMPNKHKRSTRAAKLLVSLYQLLPGAERLTDEDIDEVVVNQGELPAIADEASARDEAVKAVVRMAVREPQRKLGSSLLRHVRSIFVDELEVASRQQTRDHVEAEAIYQEYLINRAKQIALENPSLLRYSTQGHIYIDLELNNEDYKTIYYLICHENYDGANAKVDVEKLLGVKSITTKTICNIDTKGHPRLERLYRRFISDQDGTENVPEGILNAAIDVFSRSKEKASVVPLQEEMGMHLRLLSRVIENLYNDKVVADKVYSSQDFDSIRLLALRALNLDVRKIFQRCLVTSFHDGVIDYHQLNQLLDEARGEIASLCKKRFIQAMIANKGRAAFENIYQTIIKRYLNKSLFKKTTATASDYIRTDWQHETVVRITATEHTAHDKGFGADNQARRHLHRSYYHAEDGVAYVTPYRSFSFEARVPSTAVNISDKKDVDTSDSILDIRDKFEDTYRQFAKLTHYQRRPIIYNLLTSFDGFWMKIVDTLAMHNKQNESAERILKGAHIFNRMQAQKGLVDAMFYVQNIPINQHGLSLTLSGSSILRSDTRHLVVEATLMSEMSMISTLVSDLQFLPRAMHKELIETHRYLQRAYVRFLQSDACSDHHYFSDTEYGREAIRTLKVFKKKAKKAQPPLADDISMQELIANSLHKLLVTNEYREPKYGLMVQVLSVFLEKMSIAGCKSANERYQAVSGRVDLLKSINNRRGELQADEQHIIDALYAINRGEKHAFKALRKSIDTAYNNHMLYGAATVFSEEDQGAASKVRAYSDSDAVRSLQFHTNIAESRYVTKLSQANVSELQAHRGSHADSFIEMASQLLASKEVLPLLKGHSVTPVKVSNLLNTGLVSAVVPAIIRQVQIIAQSMRVKPGEVYPAYELLKNAFAKYYGIEPDALTWPLFNKYLCSIKNDFSLQLIMTPVLMDFMGEDEATREAIGEKLTVGEDGRYSALSYDELSSYLCEPLSLSLQVTDIVDSEQTLVFEHSVESQRDSITIYHDGGEYRLTTDKALEVDDSEYAGEFVNEYHHAIGEARNKEHVDTAKGVFVDAVNEAVGLAQRALSESQKDIVSARLVYQTSDEAVSDILSKKEIRLAETKAKKETMATDSSTHDSSSKKKEEKPSKKRHHKASKALSEILGTPVSDHYQELVEALSGLGDKYILNKLEKMADVAFHVLKPTEAANYQSYLKHIQLFIKQHIKKLQKDIEKLKRCLDPETEEGRLYLDKLEILTVIKNEIASIPGRIDYFKVLMAKVMSLIEQFEKAKEGRLTLGFEGVTTQIIDKGKIAQTMEETIAHETQQNALLSKSKVYKGLDPLKKGQVALHRWQAADATELAYAETDTHSKLYTVQTGIPSLSSRNKMELAMSMIRQQCINMDELPKKGSELYIKGIDVEMVTYMWASARIMAKELGFSKKFIIVDCIGFKPETSFWGLPPACKRIYETLGKHYVDGMVKTVNDVFTFKQNELGEKQRQSIGRSLAQFGSGGH